MSYSGKTERSADEDPLVRIIENINMRLREVERGNEMLNLEIDSLRLLIEENKQ